MKVNINISTTVEATSFEDALNKLTSHLSKVARTGASEGIDSVNINKFPEGFDNGSRAAVTEVK